MSLELLWYMWINWTLWRAVNIINTAPAQHVLTSHRSHSLACSGRCWVSNITAVLVSKRSLSVVSVSRSLLNSCDIRITVVVERIVCCMSNTQRPVIIVTAVRYVCSVCTVCVISLDICRLLMQYSIHFS